LYARKLQFRFIELYVDSLVVVKDIISHGHGRWREVSNWEDSSLVCVWLGIFCSTLLP